MATSLNVTLTQALLNQLNQQGVWLDYVGFNGSNSAAYSGTLFTGGQGAVTGPLTVQIPLNPGGGQKIYFIEASSNSATSDPIPGYVANGQSSITVQSAYTNNYRFDSFEVSLKGVSGDQGNLTSVVGFGLPMGLVVPAYNDGTYFNAGSQAGYNINGAAMFAALQGIQPTNTGNNGSLILNFNQASQAGSSGAISGPLTGPRYATAPASSAQVANPANPPYSGDPFPNPTVQAFSPANWNNYLSTLASQGAGGATIGKLAGIYTPSGPDANGIWHEQGLYNYNITTTTSGGNFLLSPTTGSQVQGYIVVSQGNLANSIYSTLGTASIYSTLTDAQNGTNPYTILNPSTATPSSVMNVGANNQWGAVFTQFLTGLSAGYFGGVQGISPNAAAGPISLSNNWNWDPTYAFGGGFPIFGGTSQVTGKPSGWFSDPYSQQFFLNSNSYGSGYSDNLMKLFSVGGPQLTVGTTTITGAGSGPDVPSINLTIYGDNETPSGYQTPLLYSYIAPPPGGYQTPDAAPAANNISMNFALPGASNGATSLVADQSKAQITFSYVDKSLQSGFGSFVINVGQDTTPLHSLWQIWNVTGVFGGYVATPSGVAQAEGTILLQGMPLMNNGVTWSKIQVDTTDGSVPAKVFNLYTTETNGLFNNTPGSNAIDGGASIALPAAGNQVTFTINFLSGASTSIDGSLLVPAQHAGAAGPSFTQVIAPTVGTPWSPVAGTVTNGGVAGTVGVFGSGSTAQTFTAPSGANLALGAATTETLTTTTDGSGNASVAFAWTGAVPAAQPTYNSGKVTNGIDSGYTNKILAGDTAQVSIYAGTTTTGTPVATATATADIDGQWLTNVVKLAASATGTQYTAIMQELHGSTQITNVSTPLSLTIIGQGSSSAASADAATIDVVGVNLTPEPHF